MSERLEYSPEIEQGNALVAQIQARNAFLDQPNTINPVPQTVELISNIQNLVNILPDNPQPTNLDQLYLQELKRRLSCEAVSLSNVIATEAAPWEQVIKAYGIPFEDLEVIEPWLENNMDLVKEANRRLFDNATNYVERANVPTGIGSLRARAEQIVENAMGSMNEVVLENLGNRLGVREFIQLYTFGADSTERRSYLNYLSKVLGISTQNVTYMRDGEIYIIPEELISLMGHEGLGHARHNTVTEASQDLPSFLKIRTGPPLQATNESIAQYFEAKFFDYLALHPSAVEKLKFTESFDHIYQRYKDTQLLNTYMNNLYYFAILTLAQSKQEDTSGQAEKISKYSINPSFPRNHINRYRNDWDKATGRLMTHVVSELRYAANPVARIMSSIPKDKVSQAEDLILKGFWTPQGLEQWVDLNLKK